MGLFSKITRPFKKLADKAIDFLTDIGKAALEIIASPFGLGDFGTGDLSGQQTQQEILGPLLNKDSGVGPIPVVYGKRRVGGYRVFVSTNGTNNEYLYVALVLSEGQIDGFETLYIDDVAVPLSSYAHGTEATPSSGDYVDRVVCQFFDGRDDQTVSSLLDAAPGWGSNHRLRGLAYLALRFRWKKIESQADADNNPFRSGIPKVNAIIRGRKILDITGIDPATYNTAYGSDTVTYTNNPVSVLIDYMRNDRYGKGLENDYFDWTSIKVAAEQCDQTVPYTTTPTTGKAYVMDGVVPTENTLLANIRSMLANFKGIMPYQQGQYYLRIEHGGDPNDIDATPSDPAVVATITQEDLIGGLFIQGESKDRKYNQARITYTDPDADYQANDVVWPDDNDATYSTYLSEDIVPLTAQFALPYCTNRERALNYAELTVKTSRNKMSISFATTLAHANISVGDLVRVTNTYLNFDGIFRILTVNLTSAGTMSFSASEHNSADYGLTGHTAEASRPTINLPNPLQVIAPTSVTVASGSAYNIISNSDGYVVTDSTVVRLYVSWTATTDPYAKEYIVQYKLSTDSDYITVGITNDVEFYINNVAVGSTYNVRVASRNELDRRSNYASASPHTVIS